MTYDAGGNRCLDFVIAVKQKKSFGVKPYFPLLLLNKLFSANANVKAYTKVIIPCWYIDLKKREDY